MRRRLLMALVAVVLLAGAYAALLLHPQPLFAYRHSYRHIIVSSDQPIPGEIDGILDRVVTRLHSSPLFDGERDYFVYLCQSRWRFVLLANAAWRAGGRQSLVGRNVFLRPSDIARDRLYGPSGREVTGERTLTYFIAHELTHTMTLDALGRWRYGRLPEWVREGYGDYVGKYRFDTARALDDFRAGVTRMDPRASGLYDRYHLMVWRVLDQDGVSVAELLARPPPAKEVERRLATRSD
jgi:hypothetical protein